MTAYISCCLLNTHTANESGHGHGDTYVYACLMGNAIDSGVFEHPIAELGIDAAGLDHSLDPFRAAAHGMIALCKSTNSSVYQ